MEIYLIAHAAPAPAAFAIPPLPSGLTWHRFIDTAQEGAAGHSRPGEEIPLDNQQRYLAGEELVVVLVSAKI